MEAWREYLARFSSGIDQLVVTDSAGKTLDPADGYSRWVAMARDAQTHDRWLYFIGNGASAMMASHFAADACKNAGLRAVALNDPALLTATANDVAFDQAFSLPLSRLARAGDLLISTSSSGRSPNVVRALEQARASDLRIVTLSGWTPDNPSRRLGDLNFYVPAQRYGWVECAHQVILHYWLDQFMNLHGSGAV